MDRDAYVFDYLPVLFTAAVGFAAVFAILSLASLIAPRQRSAQKELVYECGMLPIGRATTNKVHIRYYLFAILFMIFEVEVAFLFPWAVILKSVGVVAYVEMLIFLAILVFGLVYAWKKGVLEWAG